jgi:hypothetical protein
MKRSIIYAIGAGVVLALAVIVYRFAPGPVDVNTPAREGAPSAPVAIANPASTFCVENGGTIAITGGEEGQIGTCSFPGGTSCEEWALFRGECNVVGVSNTGVYSDGTNEVRVVYRMKTRTAVLFAETLVYDGLDLAQAMSGSGTRYLSLDGTVEFWEHQGEGTLSVDGKELFRGNVK